MTITKKCLIKIRRGFRDGNNNFQENWKEEGLVGGIIKPMIQNWIIALTAVLYVRMVLEFFRAATYNLPLA